MGKPKAGNVPSLRSRRSVAEAGIAGPPTTARHTGGIEDPSRDSPYRSLFERVPIGLYRSTPSGKILDANPAFLRILGYPDRETLMAVNAASLYVDPEARQRWTTLLEREGVVADFESKLWRHDGTAMWIRASAHAVRAVNGRTRYLEGAIVDITERKTAEAEIRRRAAELETFFDLSAQLRKACAPEEMYPVLLGHGMRLLCADHGSLALLSPDRPAFMRVYTVGTPTEERGTTFPLAGTPSGRVVETGAPFVTDDFVTALSAGPDVARYQQLGPVVIVPVRSEQEFIGTIALGRIKRAGSHPFVDAEVRLLEGIAEIGGTAIHRARLHHKLQQAYVQMVIALAQAIESRDSYTAEHGDRMVDLAERTARELGCPEGEVQDIRWGARLHDIGKIGVPDAILSKPGGLTEQEWATMRRHPILGEEILSSLDRMRGVAKLVRHHQEKWDGTGYPDGLTGDAIPLGSRILAVVDAYGAITEARPYKPARTVAEAVAEIKRCAGNQFDPRVTEVFCKVVEEFI
ncbi:MAG TPA: HD domain-containing phosphohydrolase [bacterium]|nr:HD domain-containing phosphohydrolase [bacterium]